MKEIDYSLGVDPEVRKKTLERFGLFTKEQIREAAERDLNIAAFVIPYDEVMKNVKDKQQNEHDRAVNVK